MLVLFFGSIMRAGTMKKLTLSVLLLSASLLFAEQAVRVKVDSANVRGGPSTRYSVIGRVTRGEEIPVLGSQGGWLKVRLADGTEGWVYSKIVSKPFTVETPAPPKPKKPGADDAVLRTSVGDRVVKNYNPEKNYVATIETSLGTFKIELLKGDAPNHTKNFIDLANNGFYDGLLFHRAIEGYLIQGGDPNGNGTGGPGYAIKAERNERKHLKGTVSMARIPKNLDSAGSQFFICLSERPELDGKWTVFGQVTDGMEVVDRIGKIPTSKRLKWPHYKPVEDIKIEKIVIEEKK